MEELRKHVISTQRQVHDVMDKPNHAVAIRLKRELQALEDDLQVEKHALSIKSRVEQIIRLLEGEAKAQNIMDYGHIDMFKKSFERVREQLARMA